jgi:hypothetical protein
MRLNRTVQMLLAALCGAIASTVLQAAETQQAPPLPKLQSPVEFFRQLLGATPKERERLLADKSEAQRRIIDSKIQEYSILPPPVREWRLKATELRYYLVPMMNRAPDARGDLILTVPDEDRELVKERLRQWDALPASERESMLNSQIALRYLARPPQAPKHPTSREVDPDYRKLESAVANWTQLPAAEQEGITKRFNSFFSLSAAERQKTISVFTGSELAQLRSTVSSFEDLSPAEREKCLHAMAQISEMTHAERIRFLRNVKRWKSLNEQDREQWRNLVAKVPPLPPGLPRSTPR